MTFIICVYAKNQLHQKFHASGATFGLSIHLYI